MNNCIVVIYSIVLILVLLLVINVISKNHSCTSIGGELVLIADGESPPFLLCTPPDTSDDREPFGFVQ